MYCLILSVHVMLRIDEWSGLKTDYHLALLHLITTTFCNVLQQPSYIDPLNLTAMACPALPLCSLAITEAERGIPDMLKRVRAILNKVITLELGN